MIEDYHRIDIDDFVTIYFTSSSIEIHVKVLHRPVATGDCWTLIRGDGTIFNVLMFEKMERMKNEDSENPN